MAEIVPIPSLDNRTADELKSLAYQRIYEVSGGKVSDFSDASVVATLVEGQVAAIQELQYELNKLPLATALAQARLLGATRRTGTRATAPVRFQLSAILNRDFTIPVGYKFSLGGQIFTTDRTLTIPAQTDTSNSLNYNLTSVTATATVAGSQGNVPAQQAVILNRLDGLQAIIAIEPARNGSDQESLNDFVERYQEAIRRRGLISRDDFKQAVQAYLGQSAAVLIRPNIAADNVTVQIPSVHVYALNPDGSELNSAQRAQLAGALSDGAIALDGAVFVSSLNVVPVKVEVFASGATNVPASSIASNIYSAIKSHLTPGNLPIGQSIRLYDMIPLIYAISGVTAVIKVAQADSDTTPVSADLALPNEYSVAKLNSIYINLIVGDATYDYQY